MNEIAIFIPKGNLFERKKIVAEVYSDRLLVETGSGTKEYKFNGNLLHLLRGDVLFVVLNGETIAPVLLNTPTADINRDQHVQQNIQYMTQSLATGITQMKEIYDQLQDSSKSTDAVRQLIADYSRIETQYKEDEIFRQNPMAKIMAIRHIGSISKYKGKGIFKKAKITGTRGSKILQVRIDSGAEDSVMSREFNDLIGGQETGETVYLSGLEQTLIPAPRIQFNMVIDGVEFTAEAALMKDLKKIVRSDVLVGEPIIMDATTHTVNWLNQGVKK